MVRVVTVNYYKHYCKYLLALHVLMFIIVITAAAAFAVAERVCMAKAHA